MQTTTSLYNQLAQGHVRPLSWQLRVSFDKALDDTIDLFTLDTSVLDGVDVLAPSDTNVVVQWDKYIYENYTDRVISMEWQREELFPYSVNQSMADITLNNYDGYFTRNSGSPVEDYLVPKRPIRILAGFGNSNLPQFVGMTTTAPLINKSDRTAEIHCVDFLSYLFERPLDQTLIMQDYTTDDVLNELLLSFGLTSDQFVLDIGYNRIPFVYFEKGKKFGEAVKELMEAELGSLYMDELGIIRFRNRLHLSDTPVYTFNDSNIIDYETSEESKIINVVEITAEVRVVQPVQTVYTLSSAFKIPAAGTTEVFFNFDDPVTSLSTIDTYLANSLEDGSGSDVTASVTVTDVDLFNTAVKVTFANTTGEIAYLTTLTIFGTPAKITRNIYLRTQDDDSVEAFEEQVYTINNNFIQSDSAADSVALSLLNYYKDYGSIIELTVKGNYALQQGDTITIEVDDITGDYTITKIINILSDGKFTQRLTARIFNTADYFTLDSSLIEGSDVLAP